MMSALVKDLEKERKVSDGLRRELGEMRVGYSGAVERGNELSVKRGEWEEEGKGLML
jgi:hypothetical protein